ncbi:hypothetical protein FN846DRAFT_503411 [Sphaerosporella brunnea]|uniref:Uncharacterized protein n=1 Tax=Sphaerosporella brunnea TaxID=1250544 RepID=A0A5J5EF74_9PEZI|nr:hypothetical protein FN846DRAFT_503411 [Sphaerosporella brunnea]
MDTGLLFSLLRVLELLTLIPIWGMLSWFVNAWQPATTPPDYILFLFIVSLLATVYALLTLLDYRANRWTPLYVSLLDLCFFGVLIGGVVVLAPYAQHTDCLSYTAAPRVVYYGNGSGSFSAGALAANRQCLMLKASWGLGVVDVLLFFFTAVLAWMGWYGSGVVVVRRSGRRGRW